jgi:hypothetical protein
MLSAHFRLRGSEFDRHAAGRSSRLGVNRLYIFGGRFVSPFSLDRKYCHPV